MCVKNASYDESIEILNKSLDLYKSGDYKQANESVSLMEAYLPLNSSNEKYSLNSLASRFVSLSFYIDSSKHKFKNSEDEFIKLFIKIGQKLKDYMSEKPREDKLIKLNQKMIDLNEYIIHTGEKKRFSEDSGWGKIAKSYIETDD